MAANPPPGGTPSTEPGQTPDNNLFPSAMEPSGAINNSSPASGQQSQAPPQNPLAGLFSQTKYDLLEDDLGFQELVEKLKENQGEEEEEEEDTIDVQRWKISINELPPNLKNTEPDASNLYPDFLPCDEKQLFPMTSVFAYRGNDRPLNLKSHSGTGKVKIGDTDRCMIQFIDLKKHPLLNPRGLMGWPQHKTHNAEQATARCIKNMWVTDSQYPSFNFKVDRGDGAPAAGSAVMSIFGTHIKCADESKLQLKFWSGNDHGMKSQTDGHEELESLIDNHGCWKIQFILKPRTPGSEPVWHGISTPDLHVIKQKFHANDPTLSYADRIIGALCTSTAMTIYRPWDKSDVASLKPFQDYMKACIYASARYGNFWWFKLGSDVPNDLSLSSPDYPFTDGYEFRQSPRWLTTKVRVTMKNDSEDEMSYVPLEWAPFLPLDSGVYPDGDTVAFAHRLGMAREVQKQDEELARLCEQSEGAIVCKMHTFHDVGTYLADIWLGKLNKVESDTILPELKRRVRLGISFRGFDVSLQGQICEDAFLSGAHFSVVCWTKNKKAPPFDDPNELHNVTLVFLRDVKSVHRCMNAISSLQRGHNRTDGVQLPNKCFGAPVPAGAHPQHVLVLPADAARYDSLVTARKLNRSQTEAANQAKIATGGFKLIWGPPGTGKTYATDTQILALASLGYKIVVTASTNSAVAVLAGKFGGLNNSKETGILDDEWFIFKGAYQDVDWNGQVARDLTGVQAGKGDGMKIDEEEDDDPFSIGEGLLDDNGGDDVKIDDQTPVGQKIDWAADAAQQAAKDQALLEARLYSMVMHNAANSVYNGSSSAYFPDKKLAYIKSILDRPHVEGRQLSAKQIEQFDHAKRYMRAIWGLQSSSKCKTESQQEASRRNKNDFLELDQWWTRDFFENKAKIIFVTNNSSCHKVLTDNFEPTILVSDEAGQSTPADAMTPMAAFKESLLEVTLVGDHQQLKPTVLSRHRNEAFNWTERSLFQVAFDNKHAPVPITTFDTQYRMPPAHSAFVNRNIYNGFLKDDPSVRKYTPNRQRFATMMSKLDKCWNGRLRVAFDVPGQSAKFKGTESACNVAEAEFCVNLALQQVKHGIPSEDIVIVTPYTGQQRMIKQVLFALQEKVVIQVKSINEFQGHEASSVILSFVRNDPSDATSLGFIYHRWMLCVGLTRATDAMCLIGNFRGWTVEINKKDPTSFFNRTECALFTKLNQDLNARGDIIALSDFEDAMKGQPAARPTFYKDLKANAYQPRR